MPLMLVRIGKWGTYNVYWFFADVGETVSVDEAVAGDDTAGDANGGNTGGTEDVEVAGNDGCTVDVGNTGTTYVEAMIFFVSFTHFR